MLETILKIAPPALLLVSLLWWVSAGTALPRTRRRLFLGGLLADSLAYIARFLLLYFLRTARLHYWEQVDTTIGIGGLMFLAALLGLIGGCFGRSYGRICACAAGVTIAALWWFTGVATL